MTKTILGGEAHLTFKGNLTASRYGWLRLTPAYSVHLVNDLLDRVASPTTTVLDPYCGTGTTALVCAEKGLASYTTDINPFLVWLARAKAAAYTPDEIATCRDTAADVAAAISDTDAQSEWVPALHQIEKWWDAPTLHALGRAMAVIRQRDGVIPSASSDLLRVAFCRTLIERASVSFGHQSMSFKKRKAQESLFSPEDQSALVRTSWTVAVDALTLSAKTAIAVTPEVLLCDARALSDLPPVASHSPGEFVRA